MSRSSTGFVRNEVVLMRIGVILGTAVISEVNVTHRDSVLPEFASGVVLSNSAADILA